MKVSVVMAVMAVVLFSTGCGGKKAVTTEELPQQLHALIARDFPGESVAYALREKEGLGRTKYEVVLSDGTGIEADGDGDRKEIKCSHGNSVPVTALPQQIHSYLDAKHPDASVRKIEKTGRGYEVELSNGLEIRFNKNFVVTEYDS
ncbi:MAG: PepSY-like domain-containing protein [Alistipes sp.]|nr:PepSY-like domain-containing protein [Alistipes sp.]